MMIFHGQGSWSSIVLRVPSSMTMEVDFHIPSRSVMDLGSKFMEVKIYERRKRRRRRRRKIRSGLAWIYEG